MIDILDIDRDDANEADRLRVLKSYDILDTDPQQGLDEVAHLAARICRAPIAMVTLAVGSQLVFKSRVGIDLAEVDKAGSFCLHAMQNVGVTEVRDATQDPMFADHPMVTGAPGICFYAGATLIDDQGLALGTLCVIDTEPRPAGLDETQAMALDVLSKQVMAQLERRRALKERRRSDEAATLAKETALQISDKLAESEARFQAIADSMPQMVWSARPDGFHDYYNARWYDFTGAPAGSTDGEGWSGMFHPDDQERAWALWRESLATGALYEIEYRLRRNDGVYRWTLGRAAPIRNDAGQITRWFGSCTDIDDIKKLEQAKELLSQELSHRIKNIFAVVSALLGLSARRYPEAKAFAQSARTQIAALARAHEFVRPHSESSRPSLDGSTLHAFLKDLFLAYDDDGQPRIIVSGDDAAFDDQAATPVALLFHELATNAAKYGALSVPGGRVLLATERRDGRFLLTWTETGGPPILSAPQGRGFGSSLLNLSVQGQLGGTMTQIWAPEGLRMRADMPVAALTRHRAVA